MLVNNAAALAKAAKAFAVPTILTSVIADRGGRIFPQITDVFPGQEVIDRTFIHTWQDEKVVDAVKATGRKQLILAGLWIEICVAPAIQALGEGWDVTVVTDASGGTSVEAHEVAIQRMIMAGANMMTWLAVAAEWQRGWPRTCRRAAAAASPSFGSSSCSTRRCQRTRADLSGDDEILERRFVSRSFVEPRHRHSASLRIFQEICPVPEQSGMRFG